MEGSASMQDAILAKLALHRTDDIIKLFECNNTMVSPKENRSQCGPQDYNRKTDYCLTEQPIKEGGHVSVCDQASVQSVHFLEENYFRWPTTPSSGRNKCFSNSLSSANLNPAPLLKDSRDEKSICRDTLQGFNAFDNENALHAQANEDYVPYEQGNIAHSHSLFNSDASLFSINGILNNECGQSRSLVRSEHGNECSFEEFLSKNSNGAFKFIPKIQGDKNVCEKFQSNTVDRTCLPHSSLSQTLNHTFGASNKDIIASKALIDWDYGSTDNNRNEEKPFFQHPAHLPNFAPADDTSPSMSSVNSFHLANKLSSNLAPHPVYAPTPESQFSGRFDAKEDIPRTESPTFIFSTENHFNISVTDPLPLQSAEGLERQFSSQHTSDTFFSNDTSQQAHGDTQTLSVSSFDEKVHKGLINDYFNVFPTSHDTMYPMNDTQTQSWHSFDQADSQTITPKRVSRMVDHTLPAFMTPIRSRLGDDSMLPALQTPSSTRSRTHGMMEALYNTAYASPPVLSPQYHTLDPHSSYHRLAGQNFPVPVQASPVHHGTSRMAFEVLVQSPLSLSHGNTNGLSSQVSSFSESLNTLKRKHSLTQIDEDEKAVNESFLGGSSPLTSTSSSSSSYVHNTSDDSEYDEDNIFDSKTIQISRKRPRIVLKRSTKNLPNDFARKVSYERSHVPDSDPDTDEDSKEIQGTNIKAKGEEEEDESINCANVLMSLGHGRTDELAFSRMNPSSGRAKRAVRRAGEKSSTAQIIQFPNLSYHKYEAPKKTYDIKTGQSDRSQTDDSFLPHRPPLTKTGIRSFSSNVAMEFSGVKMLEAFPMFYRKFQVPSLMDENAQAQIFGVTRMEEASEIEDGTLRQAAIRGLKKIPADFNEPESLLNLYTPRYMRGGGKEKQGLCPICYEEGHMFWRKTKHSQYNYHMIMDHGISPKFFLPFHPPIAFRRKHIKPILNGKRKQSMLQGQCHNCMEFVDIESVREATVKVPEHYFWKHAQHCHHIEKGHSQQLAGCPYVEDEFYSRIVQYEQGKNTN